MAQPRLTGKTVEEIEEGHIIDGNADDISQLEGDLDSQLLSITAAFNADQNDVEYKIKVYRVVPNKADREWLFDCTAEELPVQERVRDEYGAGQYAVWVYKNNKIFRRLSFRIGSPRVNAPTRRGHGDETADIIRAMLEQQQKQMEQFQALTIQMMQRNTPAPTTPAAPSMVEMMTAMATMMQTLNGISRPQGDNTNALIQGITLAKELLGDGGAGERNINDVLAKAMDTFGPVMAGAMKNAPTRNAAYIPAPRPNPAPRPAPAHPNPTPTGPTTMPNEIDRATYAQLQMYSGILIQKAASGADASLYAELVCDNVPDALIERFITGPQWFDNLASVNPNIVPHRAWFEELRAEVAALLTDDAGSSTLTDTDTMGGAGDGSDSNIDADS